MNEYIVRETCYPLAVKQEVVGELVRCKDCAHWCICHHGDNWFCADGTPINTASDYYDDKGHLRHNPPTCKSIYHNNPPTCKSIYGERKDDE